MWVRPLAMALRYISRLRQKTLIHVYAKLLRISNMLQTCVAPTDFWLILTKPSLSCLGLRHLIPRLPSNITVPFLGQDLVPVTSAKDLGVTLDANLTFNDHIASLTSLASSLLSKLVQINRVRHLFSKDVLDINLKSPVFSKLFYCSTVWSGTSKENIHKLQLMQNFAGCILNTKRFDHITPVLHELGWFTIWRIAAALTWYNHDLQMSQWSCVKLLIILRL